MMMMITAMILATGPSTDCRICCSGCSQGMLEPAAQADGARATESVTAATGVTARRNTKGIMFDLPRV
jgi:hypothetical protein